MMTILESINRVVHDLSTALIDNQITTKLSDAVTSSLKTGFEVVEDLLKIAQDLTKQETP
jgi:hypothetical protein